MSTHRTLPNLRKASIAQRWWQNQTGQVTFNESLVMGNSVNGTVVSDNEPAMYHSEAPPNESTLARARRRNILDKWTLHVRFLFTGGQRVEYTGETATRMYEVWKGIVYKK